MYDTILVGTDGSEQANTAVERALDTAETHDAELHAITVVNTSRYGEPSEELLRYADEVDADLVVLGSRGRTHPGSTIGSTANRVIRSTDREVILT